MTESPPPASATMDGLYDQVLRDFEGSRTILSFDQYVALVRATPERFLRDAAVYVLQCFEHFGSYPVRRYGRTRRRWKLFDGTSPLGDGAVASESLVGQEHLQDRYHRLLCDFAREGRANRLALLHGPNGSAKSTFSRVLTRALETFSRTDDGALYRFNWIFQKGAGGKSIGFSDGHSDTPSHSLAHIPQDQVESRFGTELREHPLLLLPVAQRRSLMRSLVDPSRQVPDLLWHGELSATNRRIFDRLLSAYHGDLRAVLHHVQVERYHISKHYRQGCASIGPQLSVDASERQVAADRSAQMLPSSLGPLNLFEAHGDLVDAWGGVLEFSDLLKRPLDAWKYLLVAVEEEEVPLGLSNLRLNSVCVASSNDAHLAAFREHHEYLSFRGRLKLMRVPYLLNYELERTIHELQLAPKVSLHIAPHAMDVAALWATITRMEKPRPGAYDHPDLTRIVAELSPLEKALLYAKGQAPGRLSGADARLLVQHIHEVHRDGSERPDGYEGSSGASPRVVRTILLETLSSTELSFLSVEELLQTIERYCEREDHPFLRRTTDAGYGDARGAVATVRGWWIDRVDDAVRQASGLVDEGEHLRLFSQYMEHVSYWVKGERLFDPVTGKDTEPDESLMKSVESKFHFQGSTEEFRKGLIRSIAAGALQDPDEPMDYNKLFPEHINRLRQTYFEDRKTQLSDLITHLLKALGGHGDGPADQVAQERNPDVFLRVRPTLEALRETGYHDLSLPEALSSLLKHRYVDP